MGWSKGSSWKLRTFKSIRNNDSILSNWNNISNLLLYRSIRVTKAKRFAAVVGKKPEALKLQRKSRKKDQDPPKLIRQTEKIHIQNRGFLEDCFLEHPCSLTTQRRAKRNSWEVQPECYCTSGNIPLREKTDARCAYLKCREKSGRRTNSTPSKERIERPPAGEPADIHEVEALGAEIYTGWYGKIRIYSVYSIPNHGSTNEV